LLRAGSQVRVATQLVEVQSGRLLWSKTTQVTLSDIFQLQDDLTREIVESLSLPLSPREKRMLSQDAPATARAYEYYLRANELASDPKSWGIARDLYQQAIDDDPRYAPAWARLGGLLRRIGKVGGGTHEDRVRAEAAVRRALELNPDLPLAHNLMAQIDIDGGRAREAMVRLIALASRQSTDPELFAGLVYACRYCGLLGPSLRADLRARRLDPSIKTSVIHTLFMMGKHEAAEGLNWDAPVVTAFALVAQGREQEALALLAQREQKLPPRLRQITHALTALLEGRRDEAVAEIHIIAADFGDLEGLYYLARQLAFAGAHDDAMRLLERATGRGFWCYRAFASDVWLDPLRHRQDFVALLQRAGEERDLARAAFASAGGDQILGAD
jgi:adenylate cyclase